MNPVNHDDLFGDGFTLVDDVSEPITKSGLRSYQETAVKSVHDGWGDSWPTAEEGDAEPVTRQLVVAATGTGKTVIMGALVADAVKSGMRVLMLAHTDELLEQAMPKFQRATGLPIAKEKSSSYASRWDKVVVASVQTMRGPRLQSWPKDHFGLILVDEAHRTLAASYMKILEHFTSRVVGVTATSDRGDKRELGKFYQRIAFDYSLRAACADGWLVRPIVKTVPLELDIRHVKTKGNDLDATEVSHAIEPFIVKIAEAIAREAASRKILIFMPSVDTSQKMAAALQAQGFAADYVHGDDKERVQKIEDYRSGKIRVLTNAYLLTEGFDDDSIDCVIVLRPTQIRSLYVQCVGRGTRPLTCIVPALNAAPHAEARKELIKRSAKPFVLLLDFLWLYEKHDLVAPASLMSKSPAEEAMVRKMGDGDLLAQSEEAERDLLEALRKQLAKHSKKKVRLVDPLTFAAELENTDLANYEPETLWEQLPVTQGQTKILTNNGVNPEMVKFRGHADKIIDEMFGRAAKGLASFRKVMFLKRQGINARNMTDKDAGKLISEKLKVWAGRRGHG